MPLLVDNIQGYIELLARLALFAFEAFAFIDAVSRRAQLFPAADKQNKQMWVTILGVALAAFMVGQGFGWGIVNILNIAGAVAAIVYLVDVRPALRSLTRR